MDLGLAMRLLEHAHVYTRKQYGADLTDRRTTDLLVMVPKRIEVINNLVGKDIRGCNIPYTRFYREATLHLNKNEEEIGNKRIIYLLQGDVRISRDDNIVTSVTGISLLKRTHDVETGKMLDIECMANNDVDMEETLKTFFELMINHHYRHYKPHLQAIKGKK